MEEARSRREMASLNLARDERERTVGFEVESPL